MKVLLFFISVAEISLHFCCLIRCFIMKNNAEWLNWITQGKALYLDKKKIQILIDQQRTNLADVEYLDLNLIESIIKAFINPL